MCAGGGEVRCVWMAGARVVCVAPRVAALMELQRVKAGHRAVQAGYTFEYRRLKAAMEVATVVTGLALELLLLVGRCC